jgi:hypothetical protein
VEQGTTAVAALLIARHAPKEKPAPLAPASPRLLKKRKPAIAAPADRELTKLCQNVLVFAAVAVEEE